MDPDDPDNMSAPPSMADSFERLLAEPADAFATPLTAGTVVAGRYQVLERIGAGAMGMVYLATDRDLERKIALKLHKRRAGTEQLRREALAMARLAHPNVVTVFEVGEHEGRTFVAMEYVAGATLRTWLGAEHRTPADIVDALYAAGEGLIAAHDAKLVHRDFKPENVLIGRDGRVRVSDFGLARETGLEVGGGAGGTAGATGVAGTPAYMAPEQALGISVDARADQYAFCAVAWEALVGPWPRDDKATKQPRIRRVLERGLAPDPANRYPTMRALLGALRAARSRGHLVLGGITLCVLAIGIAIAFAWPTSNAAAVISCDGAGAEILTVGLDVPARLSISPLRDVASGSRQRLAEYRASFVETAKQVCTNGLVDHTWSSDLYQRGLNCLDLRRRIVNRLLTWNSDLDATEMVDRVVQLESETACGDATILASRPPMPDDPAIVEEIIRLRVLFQVALSDHAARRQHGLEEAILAGEASSVANQPTVAPRLDLVRGIVTSERGKAKEAEEILARVYYAARAVDDPDLALTAVVHLINSTNARFDDAATTNWLRNAVADAKRSHTRSPTTAAEAYTVAASTTDGFGDPLKSLEWLKESFALLGDRPSRALGDALMIRASAEIDSGKPELALADYRRALAMFEGLYGFNHPTVARIKVTASVGMSALGRKEDSIRLATEGEAILVRNPVVTRDVAVLKLNLASGFINAKDYVKARKYLTESRETTVAVLGPEHPDVALIDSSFAYISLQERDYAKATKLATEALALMDRVTPKPHEDRGQTYLILCDAARGVKDTEVAIPNCEASAGEYAKGDERKILGLVVAAMVANDAGQTDRALNLLAQIAALPTSTEPLLLGRIQLEIGRARAKTDRVAALAAFDMARQVFTEANLGEWIGEVDTARAKLR